MHLVLNIDGVMCLFVMAFILRSTFYVTYPRLYIKVENIFCIHAVLRLSAQRK